MHNIFSDINSIGLEMFRKYNDTFIRSKLSNNMMRIFLAMHKKYNITELPEDEFYMKSGILPGKVYYIYSERLAEKAPEKMYDILQFNNEPKVIWIYSINMIKNIGVDPLLYTSYIYHDLIHTLNPAVGEFGELENYILKYIMSIQLIHNLHESYGLFDKESVLNRLYEFLSNEFTRESICEFFKDVIANSDNDYYFDNKAYLDSYMLLVENH